MNTTKGNLGQVMLCDNHIDIHVDNFPNFPGSNIVKVIKLFFFKVLDVYILIQKQVQTIT